MTFINRSTGPNGATRGGHVPADSTVPVPAPGETVGLEPWFPPPLSWWNWWIRPVRAERLAALRIGLSAWLLFDVLTTYLPNLRTFYGKNSLGAPPMYDYLWKETKWNWSLFYGVEDHTYLYIGMIVWIIAIVGLLTGCFTRVCAVLAFVLSTSFSNINDNIDNAGDLVRGIILFYLMISQCGATWSIDAWRKQRQGPTFVFPWPLRLLYLQMILIYWENGLHKIVGHDWQYGDSLYYVLGDATLTRFSAVQFHLPYWLTRVMTWTVLAWEVTLPGLLVSDYWLTPLLRWFVRLGFQLPFLSWLRIIADRQTKLAAFLSDQPIRTITLCFGVMFHLGILLTMELGFFPQYMLCLYLPLLPWEKWADRWRSHARHLAPP